MHPIDFVLLWVDGADPAWQADFRRWEAADGTTVGAPERRSDNGVWRYRDMGLLRHWFRAVDRFAPWVRRVFFVTCGQRPDWLDETCPKLRLVSHADFMPSEYLPTFNCRPVHFCLHRIPDLAEHFVLFDDDTLLLRPVSPDLYFREDLPVLPASLRPMGCFPDRSWIRTCYNDTYELNSHLDIPRLLRANRRKWCSVRALGPLRAASNFAFSLLNGTIPVKSFGHLPQPLLKSTFDEVWQKCHPTLERTCRNRFRTHDQVNYWLLSAWNLATGRFSPTTLPPAQAVIDIRRSTIQSACSAIRKQKFPQVCLNDSVGTDDPDYCFPLLHQALDTLLPEKSSFEKT